MFGEVSKEQVNKIIWVYVTKNCHHRIHGMGSQFMYMLASCLAD